MRRFLSPSRIALIFGVLSLAAQASAQVRCSLVMVNKTFAEEMKLTEVVVISTLREQHPRAAQTKDVEYLPAIFEIAHIIKGEKLASLKQLVQADYYSDAPAGHRFLMMATRDGSLTWQMAVELSPELEGYMLKLARLPADETERNLFFQGYLQHPDSLIARDAYDELEKVPYAKLRAMRDQMPHDLLAGWIQDKETPTSFRRLYLRMLGICGREQDIPMLVDEIVSEDPKKRGLDALIACFLTLRGKAGLPLVEERFLNNKKADYADVYAAISALRFHAMEEKIIFRQDLLHGFRCLLDRPDLADLVIPDLARLEDWDQAERLVLMFKTADVKTSWVRVPVINYLRACPLRKADDWLEECEKLDPEAVQKARKHHPTVERKPLRVARGK